MLKATLKDQLESIEGKNCSFIGHRLNVDDWEFTVQDESHHQLIVTFCGATGKLHVDFYDPGAHRQPAYAEVYPRHFLVSERPARGKQ